MFASSLSRPHRAAVEVGMLAGLYAVYEGVRGTREASLSVALGHTADVVSLERGLHVFHERAVQEWSHAVPYLPAAARPGLHDAPLRRDDARAALGLPRAPRMRSRSCARR